MTLSYTAMSGTHFTILQACNLYVPSAVVELHLSCAQSTDGRTWFLDVQMLPTDALLGASLVMWWSVPSILSVRARLAPHSGGCVFYFLISVMPMCYSSKYDVTTTDFSHHIFPQPTRGSRTGVWELRHIVPYR